jgi:hypothetical protein
MNSEFIIKNIIFLFIFQIFARTILKKYSDKSEKKHIEDIFKKKYFSNIANQVLENINKDSDGEKKSRKNIFTKISDVNNFIKSKYNEDYIKNELEKNIEEFRKKELVKELCDNKQKSHSFIPNKNKNYKIKCNIIFDKPVKNVLLKIYNSDREFIYNFCGVFRKLQQPSVSPSEIMRKLPISGENHLIDSLISNYEFVLDNYFENEESTYIEIFADGLKIDDFDINIQRLPVGLIPDVMPLGLLQADGACERLQEIDKYHFYPKKSFIIFTVNDKNYPVYFEGNIFDINESSKIHRLDKDDIFFI